MMIEVTVKVPEERLADFYSMYGTWLGAPNETAHGAGSIIDGEPSAWSGADLDLAKAVWDKFSETAKAFFSALIDNPEREFTVLELARRANVTPERNVIAGVLSWPGRYCNNAGRKSCWRWKYLEGEVPVYWMSREVAALFRQVRDSYSKQK